MARAQAGSTGGGGPRTDRMGKRLPGKKAGVKKAAASGALRGNAGRKPASKLRERGYSAAPKKKSR